MASRLNPYVSFAGDARQAMEFYATVFGGNLDLRTFGQYGMEGDGADKIMHGQLDADNGFTLMCADAAPGSEREPGNNNMAISLSGDDTDLLHGCWDKLADGGTVLVPLEKQMWGDEFGMCNDRFGIPWMVNIAGAQA
jgi:PhnB protein